MIRVLYVSFDFPLYQFNENWNVHPFFTNVSKISVVTNPLIVNLSSGGHDQLLSPPKTW